MNQPSRSTWGTSLGFVLAAAGSAIGVGNLWKFPYITWENEGGAFVIIYIGCALLVGMPILCAELIIGRHSKLSAVPAMARLGSGLFGGRRWKIAGWLGILGSGIILSYVVVIAGWALSYFLKCVRWSTSGYVESRGDTFSLFLSDTGLQTTLAFLFSAVTAWIVLRGIGKGIERANKILMPALFVILLILVIYSISLAGFGEAISFLFSADFSQLSTHSLLEAMGQAFFSLSLGMAVMITYGSYLSQKTSIPGAAGIVVTMDTAVAIIASVIMYTIIFTFPELESRIDSSTTGMLFTTLPTLFYTELPGGALIGPIFYLLVTFAAISSTISLLEVLVSLLIDTFGFVRSRATTISALAVFVLTVLVVFSLNPRYDLARFQVFGSADSGWAYDLNQLFFRGKVGVMNIMDHLVANWLLPITGLLTTIFVGWFLHKNVSMDELRLHRNDGRPSIFFWGFRVLIRFVAPAAVIYILYSILFGAQDFT